MKRTVKLTVTMLAALGVGLLGARWARADEPMPAAPGDAATIEQLITLHVEMGQMAERHSDTPRINELGHWLVRRLDRVGDKLIDYAHAHAHHYMLVRADVKAPEVTALRTAVDQMQDRRGGDFDREFTMRLARGDRESLDLLSQIAKTTSDKELRTIVRETRPILRAVDAKAAHILKAE